MSEPDVIERMRAAFRMAWREIHRHPTSRDMSQEHAMDVAMLAAVRELVNVAAHNQEISDPEFSEFEMVISKLIKGQFYPEGFEGSVVERRSEGKGGDS